MEMEMEISSRAKSKENAKMSDKIVVMIEIVVTQVQAGENPNGFRHKVTVKAQSTAFPSFASTQQMARTLGREAVTLVLDRDNMVVWTGEEEARLEPVQTPVHPEGT